MMLWHLYPYGVTWGKESAHTIAVVDGRGRPRKLWFGAIEEFPKKEEMRNLNNKRGDSKQSMDKVEAQMV